MSNVASHGAAVSVPIVVQPPPPAGRRSNVTWTLSPDALAESPTEPLTVPPGAPSETVGGKLSTVMPTEPVVCELPAMSVITA